MRGKQKDTPHVTSMQLGQLDLFWYLDAPRVVPPKKIKNSLPLSLLATTNAARCSSQHRNRKKMGAERQQRLFQPRRSFLTSDSPRGQTPTMNPSLFETGSLMPVSAKRLFRVLALRRGGGGRGRWSFYAVRRRTWRELDASSDSPPRYSALRLHLCQDLALGRWEMHGV